MMTIWGYFMWLRDQSYGRIEKCRKPGPRCVFSAIDCVKLQRGPFEHPSASRITIRLVLELAGKPHDLPVSSNASRLTILLTDECSEGPRCVFSALDCIKLQHGPCEHSSASRITIRLALELVDKPYDLPASFNASRITKWLADGCSKGPRCVFSALNYVKLQLGPFEHPSASHITIRFVLEFVGKSYGLLASSNVSRLTKQLADGCSEGLRCVFSALDCVKLQRGPSEHPSASRMVMRLALELADKPYDLSASSNASRLTIWLADGCSKGPRCIFSALDYVKSQRGPSKHSSASRMLQRGPSEHPSASRITIRLALELAGKPYDLPASSNASRLTIRLADGCSESSRCDFSDLDCVKLQCEPSDHPSASRMIMRFAIELAAKPYDLSASFNASRITKRLADGCSEVPRCVFSALNYLKLQRGHLSTHPSANRMVMRLALELAGKPYDLLASSNTSRITIRLVDGCSEEPGEGEPKKQQQEEDEENLENIQLDPTPPTLRSPPPPASPPPPQLPPASSSPPKEAQSSKAASTQPPSQALTTKELPKQGPASKETKAEGVVLEQQEQGTTCEVLEPRVLSPSSTRRVPIPTLIIQTDLSQEEAYGFLPLMPEVPDLLGTPHQEEEEQGPTPGALDVRAELTQSIEDMPKGPAKDFMLYEIKVMSSTILAFLQPDEHVNDVGHEFLPLRLMKHEANLWKQKIRPVLNINNDGSYKGITLTATKEAQSLVEDHLKWRSKWLKERPQDLTHYHNGP
ncbi:hypothetical protein L7F22_054259 [Adiantum nelumboides]|nr:hypothetical protein [Adiantum nelumboides]